MTARKLVRIGVLALGLMLFAASAQAAPVTYVLSTPGVV
jgi:hypothetical protein